MYSMAHSHSTSVPASFFICSVPLLYVVYLLIRRLDTVDHISLKFTMILFPNGRLAQQHIYVIWLQLYNRIYVYTHLFGYNSILMCSLTSMTCVLEFYVGER